MNMIVVFISLTVMLAGVASSSASADWENLLANWAGSDVDAVDAVDAVKAASHSAATTDFDAELATDLSDHGGTGSTSGASGWQCDDTKNFINGEKYSQRVINDLRSGKARLTMDEAKAECKKLCTGSCTGFFYQKHVNGHQICGLYHQHVTKPPSRHGHAEGSICLIEPCVSWCREHKQTWGQKCKWTNCKGCNQCAAGEQYYNTGGLGLRDVIEDPPKPRCTPGGINNKPMNDNNLNKCKELPQEKCVASPDCSYHSSCTTSVQLSQYPESTKLFNLFPSLNGKSFTCSCDEVIQVAQIQQFWHTHLTSTVISTDACVAKAEYQSSAFKTYCPKLKTRDQCDSTPWCEDKKQPDSNLAEKTMTAQSLVDSLLCCTKKKCEACGQSGNAVDQLLELDGGPCAPCSRRGGWGLE